MRNQTVCFTGHRNLSDSNILQIEEKLKNILVSLINDGYCFFGIGGALGFDTIAALKVIELKKTYPHIKLILVLPCLTQAKNWDSTDQAKYEDIKRRADKIVYTSEEYFRGCMHRRNRHLVDNSSICICYLIHNTGGTSYTVNYAKSKGVRVINIAEK